MFLSYCQLYERDLHIILKLPAKEILKYASEIIPDDEKTLISILGTKSLKKFKKIRFSRIDS